MLAARLRQRKSNQKNSDQAKKPDLVESMFRNLINHGGKVTRILTNLKKDCANFLNPSHCVTYIYFTMTSYLFV